jgi:methyl-accepting chemotaxis protein
MRAAEAAKSTSSLIEGTVVKIKEGSDIVTSANEAFQGIAESAQTVGGIINEISAASGEQAEGIEQLTKAMMDMDKVIQANAANAEETASASEEMNAQAQAMKENAGDLVELVYGASRGGQKARGPASPLTVKIKKTGQALLG